ncbi:MAG: CYTH domain-containing protein [Clostridiales bacterium]|nr:CYTH domain-containing protein [Clostridiales bacterium]
MEIEKKYLVKNLPDDLSKYPKAEIEQAYLSTKDPVLRIRKSNDDYFITYKARIKGQDDKASTALISKEVELPISKEAYYHLLEKADYNIISKTRYFITIDEKLTAELDMFHKELEGLYFLEVEFPDEIAAKKFNPPSWFGKDVTFDDRFKNNYLIRVNGIEELSL